jgi:hypothetical protein
MQAANRNALPHFPLPHRTTLPHSPTPIRSRQPSPVAPRTVRVAAMAGSPSIGHAGGQIGRAGTFRGVRENDDEALSMYWIPGYPGPPAPGPLQQPIFFDKEREAH